MSIQKLVSRRFRSASRRREGQQGGAVVEEERPKRRASPSARSPTRWLLLLAMALFAFSLYHHWTHFYTRHDACVVPNCDPMPPSNVAPIFYNVFVPTDRGQEGWDNARRIVAEQLQQIGDSYAGTQKEAVVIYTTVGQPHVIDTDFVGPLCRQNGIRCAHQAHYASGFEDLSLQLLHDYCTHHPDETQRVSYIHSKGSYHNEGGFNDRWRHHMTTAVTHELCLQPPDDTCNICGLHFCPEWGAFIMAGNFFAAQCGYIKQLIAPRDMDKQLDHLRQHLDQLVDRNILATNLYNKTAPWHEQTGRYAWEIWPVSHPSIRPCDLSATPALTHWYVDRRPTSEMIWDWAPRHALQDERWLMPYPDQRNQTLSDANQRMHDYFLLPGHLTRWFTLYGQGPPSDSWVWSWFPDGDQWRQAVEEHGEQAVQVLAARHSTTNPLASFLFG